MTKNIRLFLMIMCLALIWAIPCVGSEALSLGTAPAESISITPNSLSGSVVTFDEGSQGYDACFTPGASQTFCFLAESYTSDWEYVNNLWLRFPGDWNVSNVWDDGPTLCTDEGGGTWDDFSWSFETSPYEVNISHPRYQADISEGSDYCYTYYCFDVVSGTGSPNALESWYWAGDAYGVEPHYPCSSDNYTPASQTGWTDCDEPLNPQSSIPPCAPYVYLNPASTADSGCPRVVQTYTFTAVNGTGSPVEVDLMYSLVSGEGMCGGPATIGPIADSGSDQFDVFVYPDCTPGGTVTCEVTAQAGAYSDTATVTKQCTSGNWAQVATEPDSGRLDNVAAGHNNLIWSITGYGANADVRTYDPGTDIWTAVANSAPSFGVNYARSGCQHGNKVYVYGDAATPGFTGLWSYNMDTNAWTNESPTGTPPAQTGIWVPAWVHDPDTGYCYLTGGATTPGGGNLTTVYVYDPAGNQWLTPFSNFTTARDFHAAFIFTNPSEAKMLCVTGGADSAGYGLGSTQCYDFNTSLWNSENADLGALPAPWWGMGYTQKLHLDTEQQLWLIAGSYDGITTNQTFYYDVNSGTWVDGGLLMSGAVYRGSAAMLNNEIYKVGGASEGFTYQGWADHHIQCEGCELISFTDVPMGFWAEDYINAIACEGITTGCTLNPPNYCPSSNVTRQAMAAFIIRALEGEPPGDYCNSGSPFTDVPTTSQFCKYIKRLYELGITTGCTPTEYCPLNSVTRQAMAAFIIRALFGETFDYTLTPYFTDLPDTNQFFKYVQKMKDERITTGCTETEYCPLNNVTRASMAAFLARAYLGMK